MSLLQELGYEKVRHYVGGMADWTEHHEPIESGLKPTSQSPMAHMANPAPAAASHSHQIAARRSWQDSLIDAMGNRSIGQLLLLWLWMIVGFGLVYWLAGLCGANGLRSGAVTIGTNWEGMTTAVYFSFVTALSIGYGDVVPVGAMRVLAVVEGVGGLLIFGCIISKLVSRRQEELIEEIHRTTFEDRLGRVRTNLHLVLSALQAIAEMCDSTNAHPERILAKVESAATIFVGELHAIHDLLYRPQQTPDEQVLESILASLASCLRELRDLLECLPPAQPRSTTLQTNLRNLTSLANEICGECVPRSYAPALKVWMNQIQETARDIT